MLRYVGWRLLYILPIVVGVSIVCFLLVHLAPGDPLSAILPDTAPPDMVAQVRASYGLDRPLPVQYLFWLGHVLRGDLGTSIATQRPVISEIYPAVLNTMRLALGAIVLGGLLGVGLGVASGYYRRKPVDRMMGAVGITFISTPQYWLGMVLIVIFAVDLGVLPATGMGESNSTLTDASHLILPMVTLSLVPAGIIARSVRASVANILSQDYIQALHAKGLADSRVFYHVLKNAAPPVLAVMGLQFSHLLGGSILVETVFAWPGIGFLMNSAIFMRDLPVLQGAIIVLAMFFILMNLVVDVLQMLLDPRLRHVRGKRISA
jgi:peptide/nickel transport system permease protein